MAAKDRKSIARRSASRERAPQPPTRLLDRDERDELATPLRLSDDPEPPRALLSLVSARILNDDTER